MRQILRRSLQSFQHFIVFLLFIFTGCDKDSPAPLVKRYILDSEVSLASRYADPVRGTFGAVYPASNNHSIILLTHAPASKAVLVDSKGNFVKDVTLPVQPIDVSMDNDGYIVFRTLIVNGLSTFYFISPDLEVSSKPDVKVQEDPLTFAVFRSHGRSAYSWQFGPNQTSFLTAYDVNTNSKRWTVETTDMAILSPMLLFHPDGSILVIRLESENMTWGKISSDGKVLWNRETPWADVFSEGHMWNNFFWKSNGDLIVSSRDFNQPVGAIEMATFDDEGTLINVRSVPIEEFRTFAGQTDLRAHKFIETNDGGLLFSAATSSPPFYSLVKVDKKMNPGWIGNVNLIGDVMADMVKREDESIVYLTSHGTVMIFKPEY